VLVEAATNAVKQWRYQPLIKKGIPVVKFVVVVSFGEGGKVQWIAIDHIDLLDRAIFFERNVHYDIARNMLPGSCRWILGRDFRGQFRNQPPSARNQNRRTKREHPGFLHHIPIGFKDLHPHFRIAINQLGDSPEGTVVMGLSNRVGERLLLFHQVFWNRRLERHGRILAASQVADLQTDVRALLVPGLEHNCGHSRCLEPRRFGLDGVVTGGEIAGRVLAGLVGFQGKGFRCVCVGDGDRQ